MAFAAFLVVPSAHAQTATTSIEDMLKTIQALMTQIEALQKQLNTIRGEIKEVIRDGIAEGMSGDDIRKIQELLATDPTIYPDGRVTGYFGPLTKDALKRLQARHELPVTGIIDADTKTLLESYLKERFGETIPPGLLRAPGIAKKVEARALSDCAKPGRALGPLCKKIKFVNDDDEAAEDAEDAIEDAEEAIEDADDAIDDAEDGDAKDDAMALLEEAEEKLTDAKKALEDEDYEEAEELADDAKDLAEDAEELVTD